MIMDDGIVVEGREDPALQKLDKYGKVTIE
jgi:hypothetical protein